MLLRIPRLNKLCSRRLQSCSGNACKEINPGTTGTTDSPQLPRGKKATLQSRIPYSLSRQVPSSGNNLGNSGPYSIIGDLAIHFRFVRTQHFLQ